MAVFEPGVQYKDLEGNVHADRGDNQDATYYLKKNRKISKKNYVFGVQVYSSVHNIREKTLTVIFLHSDVSGYESILDKISAEGQELILDKVEIDMPYCEFFGLFKRFSFTLSSNSLLEGRSYTTP